MAAKFDHQHMYTYIKGFANGAHMSDTIRALAFARDAHKNQTRKSGEPYITHPLTIACHALALGLHDDQIIAACLLHDVVEDCGVRLDDLPVSQETRNIVDRLTHVKPTPLTTYYDRIGVDPKAAIVKLLDRCNNVSTMAGVFTPNKLLGYIQETKDFVLPLIRSTKDQWPEYSDVLFLMKYHIHGIIDSLEIAYDTLTCRNDK